MTKSDLKTGMLVQTRGVGYYSIVVDGVKVYLISPQDWIDGDDYNNGMSSKNGKQYDIVEVYEPNRIPIGACLKYNFAIQYKDSWFRLLWKEKLIETIKIGENIYNKAEFEEAVKNLKTINK